MTYFLDNTFPKALVEILRLLRVDAVHLQEEFAPETPDEVWIPAIAGKDYVLLTGDGRIRKGSVERAALEESLIPAIFLYPEYPRATVWKQVAFLVEHWPDIDREARRMKPGELRYLNPNGKIITYAELATKRKKR